MTNKNHNYETKGNWSMMDIQNKEECKRRNREIQSKMAKEQQDINDDRYLLLLPILKQED